MEDLSAWKVDGDPYSGGAPLSAANGDNSNPKVIPKKEFWMFGVAALGQGMIYAMMSSYITDFYIQVLNVPLLFIMLLMLLARVWDAINDPLMGMLVDRFTTKWGKMKPYVVFAAIPIGLLTFFMFYDPGFSSMTSTMVYAAFIYVLWGMIYTVGDVPFWSLPNVMTPHPKERGSVISFGRTLNGIGSAVPMVLWAALSLILGATMSDASDQEVMRRTYMIMAIVCSVLGIGLYILSSFNVKERIIIPNKKKREPGEPGALKRILQCKPLMLIIIMGILSSGRYLMQAGAIHVARYAFYVGPELATLSAEAAIEASRQSVTIITTVFTVCSAVGMFGAMLFMPALYKRFNYKQIVIVTSLAGFAASLLTVMMGFFNIYLGWAWSFYLCIPFIIIQCIPLGALNITSYAMIGDALDYMEWKTGFRDTGLGSACQGFINKIGNALATTFIIVMYLAIALDPTAMYADGETLTIFATSLANGQRIAMFSLVSIIPGVSLLLCAIPVFWYDLVGAKKEKITKELAEQRLERGITVE